MNKNETDKPKQQDSSSSFKKAESARQGFSLRTTKDSDKAGTKPVSASRGPQKNPREKREQNSTKGVQATNDKNARPFKRSDAGAAKSTDARPFKRSDAGAAKPSDARPFKRSDAGAAKPSDARPFKRSEAGVSGKGSSTDPRKPPMPGRPAISRHTGPEDVKIGDVIVVTIRRMGVNGEGIGLYMRKTVFIQGALPDEVMRVEITRVEPGYFKAKLKEIEKSSPHRIKPVCPVHEEIGCCKLQHMTYSEQLKTKETLVREAFAPYSGLKETSVRPIIGMTTPWAYSNYVQVQVASSGSKLIAGMYSAGKIVDITKCPIQHPEINRTIQVVRDILEQHGIDVYNDRTKQGVIRSIAARRSVESGSIQLALITGVDKLPDWRSIVQDIRRALPLVVGISQNVNTTDTPLVFGVKTNQLWGLHKLNEKLGNLALSLSAQDHVLTNLEQSIKLYEAVKEAAALTGRELVIDTSCGSGTFGLTLAENAREVRGIDSSPVQVTEARNNAVRSNVTNTRFYEGQTELLLPQWFQEGVRPDIVVLHPPRTGCDPLLLSTVTAVGPTKIIYISSNPTTLAKDCKALYADRYVVEWTQPIDMSPQTSHMECCTLLVRKEN